MCGIVAMLGREGRRADATTVRRMAASIRHRGPDDQGSYVEEHVGLGFVRLSILDLSAAAHQPMRSACGNIVIAFNGEIYNYVELARELRELGRAIRSTGDAEVLLQAYEQWGLDCFARFNGMWSVVIYDKRQKKTFACRDRFGKKPLFVFRRPDCVFLASEIKAFFASGEYRGSVDWQSCGPLLGGARLEDRPEPRRTFFEGIEQVPPGVIWELSASGAEREYRFWSLSTSRRPAPLDPVRAFSECMTDAVRVRMRSDVPVGAFLSGGLDSTAIVRTMSAIARASGTRGDLSAYSFHTDDFDERALIDETVRGTAVRVVRCSPGARGLWSDMERLLHHQDEPVHALTALAVFELSKRAAQDGVKVVLSGGGADEVLAGYGYFFLHYWYGLLQAGRAVTALREIREFAQNNHKAFWPLLGTLLGEFMPAPFRELIRARARPPKVDVSGWYRPRVPAAPPAPEPPRNLEAALSRAILEAPLPLYLRTDDRSSMAHGVELRAPFLDVRLVELAFQLGASFRIRGPWTKVVLREASAGLIPESVRLRRQKWGFPLPVRRWFAGELYEPVSDLLRDRTTRERGVYDVKRIQADLERHCGGSVDFSSQLFQFAQLELWLRQVDSRLRDCARAPQPSSAAYAAD